MEVTTEPPPDIREWPLISLGTQTRTRWGADTGYVEPKGRVVAESYAPGAVVSEVARRHEIKPQHLFALRRAARGGRLALPVDAATPVFVPVVTAKGEPDAAGGIGNRGSIVIEIGGALVRAEPGVDDVVWLRDVLRAVEGGDMIAVPAGVRVMVATKPVDFGGGADGLVPLVRETLGRDPFSGTIFVFRSKRADRVKIVAWDGWWPPIADDMIRLTSTQLAALVDSMD